MYLSIIVPPEARHHSCVGQEQCVVVPAAHLHDLLYLRVRRELREYLQRHAVFNTQLAVIILAADVRDTGSSSRDRVELSAGNACDIAGVVQHRLRSLLVNKVSVAQLTGVISPTREEGAIGAQHDAVVVAAGRQHHAARQQSSDGPWRELTACATKPQLKNRTKEGTNKLINGNSVCINNQKPP